MKAPKLNEMPAFAMAHRIVGDPLEEICTFLHAHIAIMRLDQPFRRHVGMLEPQEESIDLLPHGRRDFLARLARVLARGG